MEAGCAVHCGHMSMHVRTAWMYMCEVIALGHCGQNFAEASNAEGAGKVSSRISGAQLPQHVHQLLCSVFPSLARALALALQLQGKKPGNCSV